MSDNWVVQNLENALEVWNDKLSEIWQLITQSPQDFKRTHVFIDEFHVMFENEFSAAFFNSAWRQFRKRNAYPTAITQNVEASPGEYAEDKVEYAADDLTHDAANVAVSETKTAVRQGRDLIRRQREKKAAEKQKEDTTPTEQTLSTEVYPDTVPEEQPSHQYADPALHEQFSQRRFNNVPDERLPQQRTETAPEGRLPKQRTDVVPEAERTTRYQSAPERRRPTHTDMEHSTDAPNTAVERGWNLAREQVELVEEGLGNKYFSE